MNDDVSHKAAKRGWINRKAGKTIAGVNPFRVTSRLPPETPRSPPALLGFAGQSRIAMPGPVRSRLPERPAAGHPRPKQRAWSSRFDLIDQSCGHRQARRVAYGVELDLQPRGQGGLRGDLQDFRVYRPPGKAERIEQAIQDTCLRLAFGAEFRWRVLVQAGGGQARGGRCRFPCPAA